MRCDVAVKSYVRVRDQLSDTPHFPGEKTEAQKAEVTASPSKLAPRPDGRRSPSSGPWRFLYLPASARLSGLLQEAVLRAQNAFYTFHLSVHAKQDQSATCGHVCPGTPRNLSELFSQTCIRSSSPEAPRAAPCVGAGGAAPEGDARCSDPPAADSAPTTHVATA